MKRYLLVAVCLLSLILAGVLGVQAQESAPVSEPLSDEVLVNNCVRSQNRLKDVTKTLDRRARVDRLQAYRYISGRLDVLVQRLEKNNQPYANELRQKLKNFDTLTEDFKNDYESYDLAREALATLPNCSQNVAEFRAKLSIARTLRAEVASDIAGLNSLLSVDITTELRTLYQTLQITGGSGAGL